MSEVEKKLKEFAEYLKKNKSLYYSRKPYVLGYDYRNARSNGRN